MRFPSLFPRAAALALLLLAAAASPAGDYFLDGAQQRELLMTGLITGRDGARYDVWIVPGYEYPRHQASKGWRSAREELRDYGQRSYYRGIVTTTRKVMRFARRDVIADFAFDGTAGAWRESAQAANERVRRRVFGWWLAWPWALVEASAESVVRVGAGVPGGVGLWAGGAVATPAVMLAWPATMSGAYALGQGTALPLAAGGWNTVVAPPLALLGQQPSPERADGWWMTRLQDPAEAGVRAQLAAWQQEWQAEPELARQRQEVADRTAAHQAIVSGLQAALAAEQKTWATVGRELNEAYRQMALERALAALPALQRELSAQGYGAARLEAMRGPLLDELVKQGLDRATADRVLDGLAGRAPVAPARQPGDKTDPLQQVIERSLPDENP
ncbi:MAG: hypothetical protein ACLGHJ_05150 [Gammaproteobacteria bacterium]